VRGSGALFTRATALRAWLGGTELVALFSRQQQLGVEIGFFHALEHQEVGLRHGAAFEGAQQGVSLAAGGVFGHRFGAARRGVFLC